MNATIVSMKVSNLASSLSVKEKREAVKLLNASIKEDIAKARESRAEAKVARAAAKEARLKKAFERRENSIAKAKARLEKLLDKKNPVGAKAAKANRKPGKVTVVTTSA